MDRKLISMSLANCTSGAGVLLWVIGTVRKQREKQSSMAGYVPEIWFEWTKMATFFRFLSDANLLCRQGHSKHLQAAKYLPRLSSEDRIVLSKEGQKLGADAIIKELVFWSRNGLSNHKLWIRRFFNQPRKSSDDPNLCVYVNLRTKTRFV